MPCVSCGGDVEIKAKSGKSLSRFFPEVLENLRAVSPKTFVLDGELVIPVDGALSFDALQMRLHPAASRIERLSKETPATFIVFDCLLRKTRQSLLLEAFEQRRAVLEAIFKDKKKILPCAAYLEGEYGIHGLYVGVPVKLGKNGIEEIIQIKLTPEEDAALKKSAAAVKELVDIIKV